MVIGKKKALREAIDVAWNNPDGRELREQLFPEGKPSVEVFVERLSKYAVERARKVL